MSTSFPRTCGASRLHVRNPAEPAWPCHKLREWAREPQSVMRIQATQGTPSTDGNSQQGFVDVVNVEDWSKKDIGDLKPKGRVRRVLDNSRELQLMQTISNFLAEAEQTGKLCSLSSIPDRKIPPFERWAFKENHYEQYLLDLLCVNESMARGIQCATKTMQTANRNKIFIDPVELGLYRGEHIAHDIEQLRGTRAKGCDPDLYPDRPSSFARQYASILDAITEQISHSSDPHETEMLIIRLCAHIYMISVSQIAMGNRIGSVCVERIGLIKRRAANTYTKYVTEKPPLATLVGSVNSFGEHLSEPMSDVFFDELLVAASRCSMLVDSLARE